ncbi:DUF72 domain-containing protein [Derxia gummosa]|uniref:DUF72 domain-containing protein n=1 Tax=Derxia gummosa DSM 723 TaxID=1121388 RepID=A0A8B6X3M0_9BURK|nr:DUF72 domain-containing protein [Derxia gummosa]
MTTPANILVGTASWADKGLIATRRFYPPGCNTAEARLRHYASVFPLVEVDSSWYALPSRRNAELWRDRTPAGFTFNFKAFRVFTGHPADASVLPADLRTALGARPGDRYSYRKLPGEVIDELWRRQMDALLPLIDAGKFGALLFQFAPWLRRDRAGQAHVGDCVRSATDAFAAARPGVEPPLLAAEFRDRSWFATPAACIDTLDRERELGLVNVVVDEPQDWRNTIPAVWEVSQPKLAILRLHGRNEAAWGNSAATSSASRFDYDYSAAELATLADQARMLALDAKRLHVVFNTNREDQGPRNALGFIDALAG